VSDAFFRIRPQTGVEPSPAVVAFGILGNRPNPFNPMTQIDYILENSSAIYLRIYDISGKVVKTLVHQTLSAGKHAAAWNGEDESGKPVVSGVYVCRLEAAGKSDVRKIVLLK